MTCPPERRACIEIEGSPAPNLFCMQHIDSHIRVHDRQTSKRYLSDDSDSVYEPTTPLPEESACLTPASALRMRLGTQLQHDEDKKESQMRHTGAVSKVHVLRDQCALHDRALIRTWEQDAAGDEAVAVSKNEDDVLLSRGTVTSEDALMSRGTVLSDSSCDTDLSAKETPRALKKEWDQIQGQPRRHEASNASFHTNIDLDDIGEGLGNNDWEEWEMQAFKEQQEQIARDCRLLADLELRRETMQKQRQEQVAMTRLLQDAATSRAQMAATENRISTPAICGGCSNPTRTRPREDDEVIVVRERFAPGFHVSIHSLRNHTELNGQPAVVLGWMGERVKLDLADGRQLALKPQNLKAMGQRSNCSPANVDVRGRPNSAPPKRSCSKQSSESSGKLLGSKKLHKLFSSNRNSVLPFVPPEGGGLKTSESGYSRHHRPHAWD